MVRLTSPSFHFFLRQILTLSLRFTVVVRYGSSAWLGVKQRKLMPYLAFCRKDMKMRLLIAAGIVVLVIIIVGASPFPPSLPLCEQSLILTFLLTH